MERSKSLPILDFEMGKIWNNYYILWPDFRLFGFNVCFFLFGIINILTFFYVRVCWIQNTMNNFLSCIVNFFKWLPMGLSTVFESNKKKAPNIPTRFFSARIYSIYKWYTYVVYVWAVSTEQWHNMNVCPQLFE